jgi:hypothetical protein
MGAIANLLIFVVCLDLKSQLAPIQLEQFGAHRHLLAFRGGSEMLDVHLDSSRGTRTGDCKQCSFVIITLAHDGTCLNHFSHGRSQADFGFHLVSGHSGPAP